jgi:hypothetical protein
MVGLGGVGAVAVGLGGAVPCAMGGDVGWWWRHAGAERSSAAAAPISPARRSSFPGAPNVNDFSPASMLRFVYSFGQFGQAFGGTT